MIGGIQIIFDPKVLEATQERLFPISRHRSARVKKKLVKRHGGEFRMKPCMWKVGNQIIAHPFFKPLIEAALARQS